MNNSARRPRVFRPSASYLVLEGVFFAVIVAPLWWGFMGMLISVVVIAAGIALTRWRYSVVVSEAEVTGPSPTPFRKRSHVRVRDAILKSSLRSWYPHEIGSSTGGDRIAVWMLGRTERVALFRALSIDVPTEEDDSKG